MTKEELAARLNGREYRHEMNKEEELLAKASALLVVFGASDDLLEFRGAIRAEVARLREALDAVVGYVTNLEPSRDEALSMAEDALSTPASPDPRDAEIARLREALEPIVAAWSARTVSEDGTTMRVDIPFAYLRKAHTALSTPAQPDPRDARIAQLEEALKAYYALDEQRANCEECGDTPEIAAEACETCMPFADDARLKMRATLSRSPGEWLEEQRRQAKIEALEDMPCIDTDWQRGRTCIECGSAMLCARCKALAALKGGAA